MRIAPALGADYEPVPNLTRITFADTADAIITSEVGIYFSIKGKDVDYHGSPGRRSARFQVQPLGDPYFYDFHTDGRVIRRQRPVFPVEGERRR